MLRAPFFPSFLYDSEIMNNLLNIIFSFEQRRAQDSFHQGQIPFFWGGEDSLGAEWSAWKRFLSRLNLFFHKGHILRGGHIPPIIWFIRGICPMAGHASGYEVYDIQIFQLLFVIYIMEIVFIIIFIYLLFNFFKKKYFKERLIFFFLINYDS